MFKSITELKQYVHVSKNMNIEELFPSMEQALLENMKPHTGQQLITDLRAAFNSAPAVESMSGPMAALLPVFNAALAPFMLANFVKKAQVNISGTGVNIRSSANEKTAFSWQIAEAEEAYLRQGEIALDTLLEYLETNRADFSQWVASTAFTQLKNCLVFTTAIGNQIVDINNSRLLFLRLKPHLMAVQDNSIEGTIGEDYLEELLAEVSSGTFTPENAKPLSLAQKALMHLAVSSALEELTITINEKGFYQVESRNTDTKTNVKSLDADRRSVIAYGHKNRGYNYLKQLRDFLNKEASATDYVTYFTSDKYVDPTTDTQGFTNDSNWGAVIF